MEKHPELKGLSGGRKQAWINANLDLITMMHDALGPEVVCKMFNMKSGTLENALRRQELRHRPALTRADKAKLRAEDANNKANMALKELSAQSEMIMQLFGEQDQLKDNLTSYFKLMEQANGLMAKLCQATHNNLTEHISSAEQNKVGLIVANSQRRLFNYRGPARRQLAGPRIKVSRRHQRFNRRRTDV